MSKTVESIERMVEKVKYSGKKFEAETMNENEMK